MKIDSSACRKRTKRHSPKSDTRAVPESSKSTFTSFRSKYNIAGSPACSPATPVVL